MAKRKRWRTKEAVMIAEKAGLKALRTGGEAILTEAIDEAPVDSGTLRRSGTVTVGKRADAAQVYKSAEAGTEMKDAYPKELGKEKAVYISFNTPYALRQHEEVGYFHPKGGYAKYLEVPFVRNKQKVVKRAEQQIKKALRETE